jgi:hypothetical protein
VRREANVQTSGDNLILWPSSQVTNGLWLAHGPVIKLPIDSSDNELADAIRTVLSASVVGIPTPASYRGLLKPVLDVAGVRSERAFNKNAGAVQLTEEADGSIAFGPLRRDGAGWSPISEAVSTVSDATDEDLARLLRLAIEASCPRP